MLYHQPRSPKQDFKTSLRLTQLPLSHVSRDNYPTEQFSQPATFSIHCYQCLGWKIHLTLRSTVNFSNLQLNYKLQLQPEDCVGHLFTSVKLQLKHSTNTMTIGWFDKLYMKMKGFMLIFSGFLYLESGKFIDMRHDTACLKSEYFTFADSL